MRVFVATRWQVRWLTWMLGCALVLPACSRVQVPQEASSAAHEQKALSESERTATREPQLSECLAAASEQHPGLVLEATAFYVMRRDEVTVVDIELPEAPELATCVQRAIKHNPPAHLRIGQSSLAIGVMPLNLGDPGKRRHPPPGEWKLLNQLFLRRARASGAIWPGELDAGSALEWPNAAQRAELEDCCQAMRGSESALSVHLSVNYLARTDRIVLADVQVPRAPALAVCFVERIQGWKVPLAGASYRSILDTFWIDIGAPADWPEDVRPILSRRMRLMSEALQRGLMREKDPLLAELGLSADLLDMSLLAY